MAYCPKPALRNFWKPEVNFSHLTCKDILQLFLLGSPTLTGERDVYCVCRGERNGKRSEGVAQINADLGTQVETLPCRSKDT